MVDQSHPPKKYSTLAREDAIDSCGQKVIFGCLSTVSPSSRESDETHSVMLVEAHVLACKPGSHDDIENSRTRGHASEEENPAI